LPTQASPVRRSITLRILVVLIALYVTGSVFGGIGLGWYVLHPSSPPIRDYEERNARTYARARSIEFRDVELTAQDGVVLRAWYMRPQDANGDAVLLLHGVVDNRLGVYPFAKWLVEHHYTVLMPDARHHGASGGLTTYGVREVDDIHRWLDLMEKAWLEKTGSENKAQARCVYGLGESMGGMELLESLPSEPRFCAVVAESPSASFREEAYFRFGRPFHAGPWLGRTFFRPTLDAAILFVRLWYGVNLDTVAPEQAVVGMKTPVLLIHGLSDRNVLPYNSDLIQAKNPAAITIWKVPGAPHCGASKVAPEEFEKRVVDWFAQHPSAPN
jgi:dipeptidyl aminopeptidase/acylaminoacyl peptidase